MNFFELTNKRQSTRKFKTDELKQSDLDIIVEAARRSPSAVNSQQYKIHVATGEAAKKIAKARGPYNNFVDDAPCMIVITKERSNLLLKFANKFTKKDFTDIDIGILAATICYQAEDLGIGSCMLGLFKEDEIKEILNTKSEVALLIVLGYPVDDYELRIKKRKYLDKFKEDLC